MGLPATGALRVAGPCRRTGVRLLNTAARSTQRRLMVALAVTVACIPLLVIDLLSSGSTGGAVVASASEDAFELLAPTTEVPPITVTEVATTVAPPVTAAPTTTTTARRVPQATTTTTARPVVTLPAPTQSDAEFLTCVRWRESRGDYTVVDPSGQFMGAYQIYQGGWDSVAAAIGRHDLVGVAPNHASPADQDLVAQAMLARNGRSPWGGSCG